MYSHVTTACTLSASVELPLHEVLAELSAFQPDLPLLPRPFVQCTLHYIVCKMTNGTYVVILLSIAQGLMAVKASFTLGSHMWLQMYVHISTVLCDEDQQLLIMCVH